MVCSVKRRCFLKRDARRMWVGRSVRGRGRRRSVKSQPTLGISWQPEEKLV